jgi:hypothetical protein
MDVQELGVGISSPVVNGPPEIISKGPSLNLISKLSANIKPTQVINPTPMPLRNLYILSPSAFLLANCFYYL